MKKIHRYCLTFCLVTISVFCGCRSVYDVGKAPGDKLAREGSLVFVRPDKYSILGTRSLRDYTEIVYETFGQNEAGQPVVKFGLRNRGGQHWWDVKGPNIIVAAKAVFYESPITSKVITLPPVYESNWQRLNVTRGETLHYTFVSPVNATGYQVILSDAFK